MNDEFSEEDKALIKEMIEFYKVLKMNGELMRVVWFMFGIGVWLYVSNFVYNALRSIYGSWVIVVPAVLFVLGLAALIYGFFQRS